MFQGSAPLGRRGLVNVAGVFGARLKILQEVNTKATKNRKAQRVETFLKPGIIVFKNNAQGGNRIIFFKPFRYDFPARRCVDETTTNMAKENSLERFLEAQAETYPDALSEIKNGRKQSHWMWYIFPQVQGLGFSSTSKYYAIKDMDEASEFLKHPVLGSRLIDICNVLLQLPTNNANRIFGTPDDLKLRSSMTLFAALNESPVFEEVLQKYFNGVKDDKTLQIIKGDE
jgi:uncharacterized protein (DUF1810 family)